MIEELRYKSLKQKEIKTEHKIELEIHRDKRDI